MNTKETKKKEFELWHFNRFKEALLDFPAGEILSGEKPDFTIQLKGKVLGIEHTQIFYEPDSNGIVLQRDENIKRKVMEVAEVRYKELNGPNQMISVHFNPSIKWENDRTNKLAYELVDAIKNNIGKEKLSYEDDIPDEIALIHMHKIEGLDFTGWSSPTSGWVAPITKEKISSKIQEKECKLNQYLDKVGEIWLLIVANGFAPSSLFHFDTLNLSEEYETSFDRVFVFENFDKKVYELKTMKPKDT
jgi:hypothetical protein